MSGAAADQEMTAEVQVVFKTNLPEDFQVPDVQINISASSTAKELTQIVKQMLSEEGKVEEVVLKGKKFNFMIENVFVTGTVQELIDKQGKGGEETIEVYYTFALDKPKPSKSIPQDEWISTVKSLSHILNEKAKTYIVGFFNGDLKVFDKGTHAELYSVKQLHQDNIIEDALFLKNDVLDKKLIVTAGAKPTAELKISELSHSMVGGTKAYQFQTIAQSKDELNGSESFGCLSNNPLNNQFICSSGPIIHQEDGAGVHEQGILIWKLDQNILKKDALPQKLGAPTKRVRTDAVQQISPHAKIHCSGGISSLKWSGPGKIFAGCNDHSLKLVNQHYLGSKRIGEIVPRLGPHFLVLKKRDNQHGEALLSWIPHKILIFGAARQTHRIQPPLNHQNSYLIQFLRVQCQGREFNKNRGQELVTKALDSSVPKVSLTLF